ncbi:MAG: nicotinate (nicotinamide) nucleotide adenylyltransferase [Deltaproteobacteria bacterium]|nr:nicotinate (nicotinamide) nucleotide adenylyltransferase [Deltaproteobacteria bacterium]
MHVALFGGSFNPPHMGHALAAQWVLQTQAVDALWLMPCFQHPFDKALVPYELRLEMCEAFCGDLGPRIRIETIERELGGTSRTFDTISALRLKYPEHRFSLVIGSDLLRETDTWHRAAELKSTVPFIIVQRRGADEAGGGPGSLAIPDISSTEVRARIGAGLSVDSLVPRRVLKIIASASLYRDGVR